MSLYFLDSTKNTPNRFDMSRFMRYTDNYDPLTSKLINDLKSLPNYGVFTVSSEAGRPDLISYKIYGSTQYWWILLLYNDIIDAENISIGDVIYYPSLGDLESLYFLLKSSEKSQ